MQLAPGTQNPRRHRQFDWELLTCGRKGHALADGTDDPRLIRGAGDLRWHRCLRCDAWVALPRDVVPAPLGEDEDGGLLLPLRGRALRDRITLRLIAVERLVHFLVLGLLGIAVLAFAANRATLRDEFYRVLVAVQGGVAGGPVQTSGHVGIVHDLDRLFSLRSGTLTEVGIALLAYASLEGVESVGLWFAKRWAEYLTFLSTVVLLPLEVYEIIHQGSFLKVIGFLINLAVVVYLLARKRLFGLRGGGAAEAADRAGDNGWEAIGRATPPAGVAVATPGAT